MSVESALQHITRHPDDPESGWLTPERIRAAVVQVYDDLSRAPVTVFEEHVVYAAPVGRSSHVTMLPQIIPEDGWITVEHRLHSEDVIVQVSAHGMVIPADVRIVGPESVAVRVGQPQAKPTKIVVIR